MERSARSGSLIWPGLGLHHHRGDVVPDHVVQLAGDVVRCSSQAAWPRSSSVSGASSMVRSRDRSSSAGAPTDAGSATNGGLFGTADRTSEQHGPAQPAGPADPRGCALVLGDGDEHQGRHGQPQGHGVADGQRRDEHRPGREHGRPPPPARQGRAPPRRERRPRRRTTSYPRRPRPASRRRPRHRPRRTPPGAGGTGLPARSGRALTRPVWRRERLLSPFAGEIGTGVPGRPGPRSRRRARRHPGRCRGAPADDREGMTTLVPATAPLARHRHQGRTVPHRAQRDHRGPHRRRRRARGRSPCRRATPRCSALAYAVYWVGDIADGWAARRLGQETRAGAVLDIVSDRACTAVLCVGSSRPAEALPVAWCSCCPSWCSTRCCRWRSCAGRCSAPTTSTSSTSGCGSSTGRRSPRRPTPRVSWARWRSELYAVALVVAVGVVGVKIWSARRVVRPACERDGR